jgi:hypothetical protein
MAARDFSCLYEEKRIPIPVSGLCCEYQKLLNEKALTQLVAAYK